jgi:hypothetical protein
MESTFFVPSQKGSKNGKKKFCRGGRLAKNKEKRLGKACSAGG